MQQSINQLLRQKRLERNLSLEEIAQAIRIRQPFLQALEDGEFGALPSLVQARGFLRTYAEYLGLEADTLLEGLGQKSYLHSARQFKAAMHQPYAEADAKEDPLFSPPPSINPISNDIFSKIGETLRQQRENLGLTLQEIEDQTLLRIHYLKALEDGDFSSLPSSVQGRGMLNSYAKYLGLDEEQLLLQYAEGVQIVFSNKQKTDSIRKASLTAQSIQKSRTSLSLVRRLLTSDLLWAILLSFMLIGFVGWGIFTIFISQSPPLNSQKPPSVVEVLLTTATATITPTMPTPTLTSAAIFYPTIVVSLNATQEDDMQGTPIGKSMPGNVHINVVARMRAWMRVTVDGEIQFEGRTQPGSAYAYSAANQIEVLTGNAAALQIYYNQEDLGVMGYLNQVSDRIYTADGIIMPTATITLTPTITPTPTATTRAPRNSPTPTSTP